MKFMNKVAVVTGGGTGIGRAASMLLAEKGASVAIVYAHSKNEAEETVRLIEEQGGNTLALKADVSDDRAVRNVMQTVAARFDGIDYLVNNAGITHQLPFADLEAATDEVWDTLFAVNVKGMFHCARAAAPYLKRSEQGAIVNIGSIAGVTGLGSSLPYAVSKAAVHGLTKSLAHALAPEICVNSVVPGAVATRWWAGNEEKMHTLAGKLPLGRISTPDDIAEIVCAVLGSTSMTGQLVLVDNGQSL